MNAPTKEKKIWIARPYDPDAVERLTRQTGVSNVVAQILVGRGATDPEKILQFLAPPNLAKGLYPPERLPGCREAAQFLADAIKAGKKIVVYGDYDVDGMTATALLLQAIQTCGGRVSYYVPNRLEEGYGLNCATLRRLREDEGADVVVTVDCGITSLKEPERAKELGLELIVTDHHTPIVDPETGRQILPDAAAIVHPRLEIDGFEPYPCPELCGAAVALKLAWGLGKAVEGAESTAPEMRKFLIRAVGLAALGTIADVVPLQDENRAIVRFALARSFVDDLPLGLRYLAEVAGINPNRRITSEDVGFSIAPRLNAAGREVLNERSPKDEEDERNWAIAKSLLENPHRLAVAGQMGLAGLGVELLVTDRPERARELAPFVNNLNATRQKLERKMLAEALKTIENEYADDPAFVLASRDWHPGVVGVVAGRLAERFYRPTVMIALRNADPSPGSARSVPDANFSLYDAFDACSEFLERFGGHAAAAGVGVKEANIANFRAAFCDYVSERFSPQERVPKLYLDGELPFSAINFQTISEIDKLSPFGADNPRPTFAAFGVSLVGQAKRVGGGKPKPGATSPPVGRTFSGRFRQFRDERRAIAFGCGDWVDQMNALVEENPNVKFDVAFQVVFNDYFGQVELRLQDWRIAE